MYPQNGFARRSFLFILLSLGLLGTLPIARATVIVWEGPSPGDWLDPTNWNLNRVPLLGDRVIIENTGSSSSLKLVSLQHPEPHPAHATYYAGTLELGYGEGTGNVYLFIDRIFLVPQALMMGRLAGTETVISLSGSNGSASVEIFGHGMPPNVIGKAGTGRVILAGTSNFTPVFQVRGNSLDLGLEPGGFGQIDASRGRVNLRGFVRVGIAGRGEILKKNGTYSVSDIPPSITAGIDPGGHGLIDVRDTGSDLPVWQLEMGLGGTGELNVLQGGSVTFERRLLLGAGGYASGLVSGTGSRVAHRIHIDHPDEHAIVALGINGGSGDLTVENGGRLSAKLIEIGGSGQWLVGVPVNFGGTGDLTVREAVVDEVQKIALGTLGEGTLLLGSGARIRFGPLANREFICGPGGRLSYEIAGVGVEDYGFIDGPEAAFSLDGTLTVTFADGYSPDAGDRFTLFTAGSLTGEFSELDLPELAEELAWDLSRLYSDGILEAVSAPAGIATFPQWLAASGADLNDPTQTDPSGDPDRRGIPNLLRYAFDLEAIQPERSGLPDIRLGQGEGDGVLYLEITYRRRLAAEDLGYHVEFSADLQGWAPLDGGETSFLPGPTPDGSYDYVRVRDNVPVNDAGSRFLRVTVELLEP